MKEELYKNHYKFEDKDYYTIRDQENKLKELNSNKIKEMFKDAKDKLIDFEKFIDSLKNIQVNPIKPKEYYC